jgi:two-component system CheB/CheR fusion protein
MNWLWFVPASVMLDSRFEVIQSRGNTGPYLVAAPGKPPTDVLKLAREGLLVSLRKALQKASQEGLAVREEGLHVKSDSGFRNVNLEVVPVSEGTGADRYFLTFFKDADARFIPSSQKLPLESEENQGLRSSDEVERLIAA